MENNSDHNIRKAITESRDRKEVAKSQNPRLSGPINKEFKDFEPEIEKTLDELLVTYKPWVDSQTKKLEELFKGKDMTKVMETYQKGLHTLFKQEYKLITRGNGGLPKEFSNKEYVQEKIAAYSFDFVQSLKQSQKEGETFTQALDLAKLSYKHNPDVIKTLTEKYPDINVSVIKKAAIDRPGMTEEFLNDYVQKTTELKSAYPDLDENAISAFASRTGEDPKALAEDYLKKVETLAKDYPDVREGAIKNAVLGYKKPEEFIETYIKTLGQLREKYPSLGAGVIDYAAINNPQKPESFITDYLANLKKLGEKYQDLGKNVINTLAYSDPKTVEQAAESYIERVKDLEEKYAGSELINEGITKYAALRYPKKPAAFLEKYKKNIELLEKRYPQVDPYVRSTAAKMRPEKPATIVERYMLRMAEIGAKYPKINESQLKRAALLSENPEEFIDKYLIRTAELAEAYPQIDFDSLAYISEHYPTRAMEFAAEFVPTVEELKILFPSTSESLIKYAALNFPGDPKSYLRKTASN